MFEHREYFNCLKPILDKYGSRIFVEISNKYLTPIKGYSLATFVIDRHTILKYGYYTPTLRQLFLFIIDQTPHLSCYFHSESNTSTLDSLIFLVNLNIHSEIFTPIHPISNTR